MIQNRISLEVVDQVISKRGGGGGGQTLHEPSPKSATIFISDICSFIAYPYHAISGNQNIADICCCSSMVILHIYWDPLLRTLLLKWEKL